MGPGALLGDGVILESGSRVCAGAKIGARTRLRSHAILGRDCELGEDGTLHEHAVVGGEGFGFQAMPGRHRGAHQEDMLGIGRHEQEGFYCIL